MIELTAKINEINKLVGRFTVPVAPAPVPIVSNYDLDTETEVETTPAIRTKYELAFDGTKHIMITGIAPNDETSITATFTRVSSVSNWSFLFGARPSNASGDNYFAFAYSNSSTYPVFGLDHQILSDAITTDIHTIDMSQDGYYLDGVLKKTYESASFSFEDILCVGGMNTGGTIDSRKFEGSIYNFKIFQDGALVRNLYPAETLSNGTVTAEGLVDIITGSFYGMEGTA